MFQPASVSLSGPAFSFLLYETCKGAVRQNGFLLGEIIHKETTTITDNEQRQVDIFKIIKVNSVIPFPSNNSFVKGRVDKEQLKKLLGSSFSKVVAWYKYEPNSSLKFTLKDRLLHKQFRETFNVPEDLFSVCFLSMECTDNFATYNYTQNFVRYYNGNMDRLSLAIPNLSDPNDTYKNSEPASVVFNKILSSIRMDIENSKSVVAVTEIENAVQNYINETAAELSNAEKSLFQLEQEVSILRAQRPNRNMIVENNEKEEVQSEDLISFEEPVDNIPNHLVNSPETTTRRSPRTKAKTNLNDSNKQESTLSNDIPNLEGQKKTTTPKPRGRGTRNRKKS